mgnify:CR=1 FL=1
MATLAAGLILLVAGGKVLVRGAVRTAAALGVSPLLIGLTLVGFGTSTPELVTSVQAALLGSPGVAVGNVVGSNICNILGILGVTALVKPLEVPAEIIAFDGWVMLAATLAMIAAAATGALVTRREGAAMLAGYGLCLSWLIAGV